MSSRRVLLGVLTLAVAGYLGLRGMHSSEEGASSPAPAAARIHYALYCADCHGDDMAGGMASSLVDGRWAGGDSDAAILRSIADGIEADGMPAFGAVLTPAEIDALVALMRAAEGEPAP